VVSAFAENMASSYVLRVSAVNCATHAELCTQKDVKDSSEIRVCTHTQLDTLARPLYSSGLVVPQILGPCDTIL
jgi:hypothetical protein